MASEQLRPLQPFPSQQISEADQSKRRGKNSQACNECRRSRIKCDGGRPNCTTCVSKKRSCHYVGIQGETRLTATKHRLELLEKVFQTLRTGPSEQAVEALDAIRSSDDLSLILSRLAVDTSEEALSNWSPTGSSRNATPSSSKHETFDVPRPALSRNGSSPYSAVISDSQSSVPSLPDEVLFRSRQTSIDQNSIHSSAPLGAYRITLPDSKEVDRAISGFFKCSGRLFHVFSESQVADFYSSVYDRSDDPLNASSSSICCLMSVAAVGAQYEHGTYELKTEAAFYDMARHFFDDLVQAEGLDAIKVCTLLALYNILAKATVSLSYIEIGLSLSRQFNIANPEKGGSELSSAILMESKHAWRTLTFMSNWLSSTLGYVSGNDTMPYENLPPGLAANSSDILEIVQNEMTNVVILKSKILRMHLAFKDLSVLSIRSILEDLQAWYGRMPPQIRLDYPERDTFAPLTKWSIYHVHLLYLGANILLYRRMLSQHVETYHVGRDRGGLFQSMEKLFSDQGKQAVLAAKGSARILSLLLQDCGIFKRCWLVIFQSYTSCLIILHSAVQKLIHGWKPSSWADDLQKAKLCLTVLDYCMSSDSTALRFYKELKDVYDYIEVQQREDIFDTDTSTSPPFPNEPSSNEAGPFRADLESVEPGSSYLITIPSSAKPEHKERSYQLLVKLCQPFGDPAHQGLNMSDIKQRWREEPTRGLHTLMMAKLDWDLESRQPFQMGLNKSLSYYNSICSSQSEPFDTVNPAEITFPGPEDNFRSRFLGSMEPSGWAPPEKLDCIPKASTSQTGMTIDSMVLD